MKLIKRCFASKTPERTVSRVENPNYLLLLLLVLLQVYRKFSLRRNWSTQNSCVNMFPLTAKPAAAAKGSFVPDDPEVATRTSP